MGNDLLKMPLDKVVFWAIQPRKGPLISLSIEGNAEKDTNNVSCVEKTPARRDMITTGAITKVAWPLCTCFHNQHALATSKTEAFSNVHSPAHTRPSQDKPLTSNHMWSGS